MAKIKTKKIKPEKALKLDSIPADEWLADMEAKITQTRDRERAEAAHQAEMQALWDRCPKTADGVPVITDDTVYLWHDKRVRRAIVEGMFRIDRIIGFYLHVDLAREGTLSGSFTSTPIYSTRAAAEKAAKKDLEK